MTSSLNARGVPVRKLPAGWHRVGVWPDSGGVARTVLVGPGGVSLVTELDHVGRLYIGGLDVRGPAGQPSNHAEVARNVAWALAERITSLAGEYVPVEPVLMTGRLCRPVVTDPPIGYRHTTLSGLRGFLEARLREYTPEQVQRIAIYATSALHQERAIRESPGRADTI